MLTYYFPIEYVPHKDKHLLDKKMTSFQYIPISLNDSCYKCGAEVKIHPFISGSINDETMLDVSCLHYNKYSLIWEARILTVNPIDDGQKCDKCSDWTPMAISNMPDGKFRCYRCRTHPLIF